jgi:predicted site-specific integrase-resolvase
MDYKKALEVLGVSYSTLKRYSKRGIIRTYKYQMPHMRGKNNYWDEDVYALVGRKWVEENWIVGYVRVAGWSNRDTQKLEEQKELMRQYCTRRGISLDRVYEDRGPGTDFSEQRRPALHQLVQDILQGRVQALVVDHWNRLSRVAPELWSLLLKFNKCDLVIMNPALEDPYYQEEQSEDLAVLIQRAGLERKGELLPGAGTRYPRVRGQEGPVGESDSEELDT